MPLDSLPCPRNSFKLSMVWYGYFLESPNGQQKHPTCFATLLQNELNSSVHILPPRNQPVLQQIRLMQVAKSCCTKSLHVVHFTDPRQTCFAASSWGNSRVQHDSRAILSNHKSVFRQLVVMKCAALLFNSFGSDVAKQVGRFCSAFYRSFTSLGGLRKYHYQYHFFLWHSVPFIMIHSSVMQGLLSSVFSHVLNINNSSWNVSFFS